MQERQKSWSAVWDWTSCRVQASFQPQSVALEWAATAYSAIVASTGCTRNAVGSSAWQKTLSTDVHRARELHAPWMADQREVQVGPDKLEVVASFCYLGDMLSAAGGCKLWTTTRVKLPGSSRICYQFTPPLSKHVAVCTALVCGAQCSMPARLGYWHSQTSVWSEMTGQWSQICNVRQKDIVTTRSNELLVRLSIEDLDLIIKERRLRWYGHVERPNGAVKTAFDIQVDGKHVRGRPKLTWKQLTEGLQRVEALGYQPSW